MNILEQIANDVVQGVKSLYGQETPAEKVALSPTRKEFKGDYTVVVFPYTKAAKKKTCRYWRRFRKIFNRKLPKYSCI